jgi:rare lipoprotein A (peptidoglycan hydrolase)
MKSQMVLKDSDYICALPFVPPSWGQHYKITNLSNKRSAIVRHQDFGPGKKPRSRGVVVDLSKAAYLALGGKLKDGRMKVKVEKI